MAEQCADDPQPCRDFLTANAGSTDPAVVEGFVQRQFFLAVRDCSSAFSIPVVALHNNTIDDTARYRARATVDPTDLTRGTFERTPQAPETAVQPDANPTRSIDELSDWLTREHGETTTTQLTGRAGTTNIFRWCVSPDITRCHVGNPRNPDTVVWVTNEADFDRLSTQSVNVVLQSGAVPTGESATDLSSLFLVLRELIEGRFAPTIAALQAGAAVEVDRIRQIVRELRRLAEFNDLTIGDALTRLGQIVGSVIRLLVRLVEIALVRGERTVRLARLRFLNIETPGAPTRAGQTRAQLREESYDAIVGTLRAVGLHCCGADPAAGEQSVREGLRRGTLEEPDAR